jgi:hypothetical protein
LHCVFEIRVLFIKGLSFDVVMVVIMVCTRVYGLIFEHLDEFVEAGGKKGTEDGADPVDPVVGGKGVEDDVRAEGTGWVEAAACEKNLEKISFIFETLHNRKKEQMLEI